MKTLKILSSIAFGIVLLTVSSLTWIWFHLPTILTPDRVNSLAHQYVGSLFSQFPEKIDLGIVNQGWNGKRISLKMGAFCLKTPESCFDEVHLEFGMKVTSLKKITVTDIGQCTILNRFFTLKPAPSSSSTEQTTGSNPLNYFSIDSHFNIGSVQILFPKLLLSQPNSLLNGDLSLEGKNNLHLKGSLIQKGGWEVHAFLDTKIDWPSLSGDVDGDLKVLKLSPLIPRLELSHIRLKRDQTVHLESDVEADFNPDFIALNRKSAMPEASFKTNFKGKLQADQVKDSYHYQIALKSDQKKGVFLSTSLEGNYPIPQSEAQLFGLKKVFLKIEIPEFQKLVNSLKYTSSAILAPFSTLRGSVQLQLGNESPIQNPIPLSLVSVLQSPDQKINTHSEGKVTLAEHKITIDGESVLKNIRLTLPNFDPLAAQPAFTEDSRIKKNAKEQTKSPPPHSSSEGLVHFNWKIRTENTPIQLHQMLFHPYAPIEMMWEIGGTDESKITLKPFEIEYLKRKARVENLQLSMKPNDSQLRYHGSLVVPKTDYTIRVTILQEDTGPKITLSSEPPLSDGDIISVLLFNQTSAELTPDETGSVSNTQAAIENRALGLLSIWALSSTPIEAVSYDPGTKVYAARVKLANGLTATIGTNWENSQQVTLRKRLGKNFVLSTQFLNDHEDNTNTAMTLIEWFKRF